AVRARKITGFKGAGERPAGAARGCPADAACRVRASRETGVSGVWTRLAGADTDYPETGVAECGFVEEVASVDDDGPGGLGFQSWPVQGQELRPFGEDDEYGGVLRHQIRVVDHLHGVQTWCPRG